MRANRTISASTTVTSLGGYTRNENRYVILKESVVIGRSHSLKDALRFARDEEGASVCEVLSGKPM